MDSNLKEIVMMVCITLCNILWFGFFMAAVLFYGWTPYSLLVPLFAHWDVRDFTTKCKTCYD